MSKIKTLKKLWKKDKRQIIVAIYNNIVHTGITNLLSDEAYLKLTYRIRFGEKLDLGNPVTFNQKLQWLKLHDRQDRYVELVDKVKVKEYVAKEIGSQYIIPTLGVWDCFEDIDFESLPNRFVLKCNHDSGSIVICRDKAKFDIAKARRKLTRGIHTDAFYWGREWPYKNVERKILAEAYMEDNSVDELKDYKMMSFNVKEKYLFMDTEQLSEDGLEITFFDTDWKVMPFERYYLKSKQEINKPLNYDEIVRLTEKLSKDIPIAGVDYYEIYGGRCHGEITLLPGYRWEDFTLPEWDQTLGSWIKLPMGQGLLLIKENVAIHIPLKQYCDLTDYKLFCFNGEPMYCQIISERTKDEKIDFYDMDWNLQPFVGLTPLVGNSGFHFPKPRNFEKMKELSRKLSNGTQFSRIDFYEVNEKLYFSEFTLYPASGFGKFSPDIWNKKLGDMIILE